MQRSQLLTAATAREKLKGKTLARLAGDVRACRQSPRDRTEMAHSPKSALQSGSVGNLVDLLRWT